VPSVSITTRKPRAGEKDGVHYHFWSRAQFEDAVARGQFMEWVEYSHDLYGTLRSEVDKHRAAGNDVVLELDVKGARALRKAIPDAVTVFVAPPSMEELGRRLRARGTDSEAAIASRLRIAEAEMAAADEFDHIVVNDTAELAAANVAALVSARRKGA
jgi:guanylate kinase